MNREPIQKIMMILGAAGCYFLAILRAAELSTNKSLDAVNCFLECARKGWIDADCWVNFPEDIYGYFVGGKWKCRKDAKEYVPASGDVVILRYERTTTAGTTSHFVLGDNDKNIIYDPMGASETVMHGQLVSLRIISRA